MAPRRPTAWGLPLLCLLAAASAPAALAAGCPPGSAGAAGCVGCPKGKWSPGGLVNTCTACPACYTTTDVNSTSAAACVACAAGCGFNGTACAVCAVGYYGLGGTAALPKATCTPCLAGKTTAAKQKTAAADCNVCRPGYGGVNCVACAKGSWSAGGNTSTGGILKPNCTACTTGLTTASTASTAAARCDRCAPGYGASNCSPCPAGFWSPGGAGTVLKPTCAPCGPGTTTDGPKHAAASDCAVCLPGYGFATVGTATVCQVCARGKWSKGGNATAPKPLCTACAGPFTTAAAGATANASCTVRICAAGQGDTALCPACPRGKWSIAGDAATPVRACTACGPNVTTAGTGSTSAAACALCVPGYGKLGAASRCDICPLSTFSLGGTVNIAKPNCTACPLGKVTLARGSTACVNVAPAPGGCATTSPLCDAQQRCDLTAVNATNTGGSCRASFLCPACPRGYECVSTAAALAFPGTMPWCLKKATCDAPCAADEYCETYPNHEDKTLIPPFCQKKSQACGGPCPTGMACDPSTAQCGKPCTAGGNECGAPSPSQPWLSWTFCDTDVGFCRPDNCQYYNSTTRTKVAGCLPPSVCKEAVLYGSKQRQCALTTCYQNCTAPTTCAPMGAFDMGCMDTRCTPACYSYQMCDVGSNTCLSKCGQGPPCAADQKCVWNTTGQSYYCAQVACKTPCDPKLGGNCEMGYNRTTGAPEPYCYNACPKGCKVGFACDQDSESCRPVPCDPACPSGQTCAVAAGKPACRPNCSPACAAGYACDLTASPPKCVLPSPANFSVVLRISERIQDGSEWNIGPSWELDTPIGFLDDYLSGDPYNACHLCPGESGESGESGEGGEGGEDCGETGEDGHYTAKWMEVTTITGVFNDTRGDEGRLGQRVREAEVDIGGALAAGKWSLNTNITVYARSLNIRDQNNVLLPPRPLELQVGLRHKATGVVFEESYTTVGTLGVALPDSEKELCYHGVDALSAMVMITTTPNKDRLAYTLNVIKPYDPNAKPVIPAAAAPADVEVRGDEEGEVSVKITPEMAARFAEIRKKREAWVERKRKGEAEPGAPEGPGGPAGQAPGAGGGPAPAEQGARRR